MFALVVRAGLLVALVCLGLALLLVAGLALVSPGQPSPVLDERGHPVAGSLSEKIRVTINGVEHGMFLRGRDATKPVLLFVHGGAGMPAYFLAQQFPATLAILEELFVVCWWDRRGAGLSYSRSIPPQTLTTTQMVADLLAVTDYLRDRFGQQKVYLMAHSGGTFFALQAIAKAPESFHAYIAVAQITHQLRSENLAYRYMLDRYREAGDAGMLRRLEAEPLTMSVPLPASYMAVRDKAMHRLGVGTTREMRSVLTGVFLPSWRSRDYTLLEKVGIWRGKALSDRMLWDEILATDLTALISSVALPVYFLHGAHDYTVTLPQTRAFLDSLGAPLKGFYTFPHSAHSPMFEEPERFRRILEEDVLRGERRLADSSP